MALLGHNELKTQLPTEQIGFENLQYDCDLMNRKKCLSFKLCNNCNIPVELTSAKPV